MSLDRSPHRLLMVALSLSLTLGSGCTKGGGSGDAPASGTRIEYVELSRQSGIDFWHTDGSFGGYFITETLASGAGLFDYDGDGDLDIYLVNGRQLPPGAPLSGWAKDCSPTNQLYRNDGVNADGSLKLVDVTALAGVPGNAFGVGCCVADYDADGDLDLYICQLGPDILYRNDGDGTFTDATEATGLGDPLYGACAAFGDIDRDGYLDLYVSNYCVEDFHKPEPCTTNGIPHYCAPPSYDEVPDSLYHNNGDGTFTNISESAGIRAVPPGQGLGVIFSDFDDDGYPEIIVANDGSENFLWHNQRDRTFKNIGFQSGIGFDMNGDEQGSMGVDVADFNGDGLFDLIVLNYQKQTNAIYQNLGGMQFRDVAMATGIAAESLPLVSWSPKFFDYDNDGILDLFVSNGHLEDRIDEYDHSSTYLQQNHLFKGLGGGKFRDVSNETGEGLRLKRSCRGAAFGDLDNDGDIDIVVCVSRGRPLLLINKGGNKGGNWVRLQLVGKAPNLFAIGARATLRAGGKLHLGEVRSGGSYAAQNDLRLHFGLGTAQAVDSLEIRWPDGEVETIAGVLPGRLNRIVQGTGQAADGAPIARR